MVGIKITNEAFCMIGDKVVGHDYQLDLITKGFCSEVLHVGEMVSQISRRNQEVSSYTLHSLMFISISYMI